MTSTTPYVNPTFSLLTPCNRLKVQYYADMLAPDEETVTDDFALHTTLALTHTHRDPQVIHICDPDLDGFPVREFRSLVTTTPLVSLRSALRSLPRYEETLRLEAKYDHEMRLLRLKGQFPTGEESWVRDLKGAQARRQRNRTLRAEKKLQVVKERTWDGYMTEVAVPEARKKAERKARREAAREEEERRWDEGRRGRLRAAEERRVRRTEAEAAERKREAKRVVEMEREAKREKGGVDSPMQDVRRTVADLNVWERLQWDEILESRRLSREGPRVEKKENWYMMSAEVKGRVVANGGWAEVQRRYKRQA